MDLRGSVALVTGAQQGIGRAAAIALAREGADIALNYLDDKAGAEAGAELCRKEGRRALIVQGGVVSMTRAMALELAAHGIRVNAVAPGLTDTAQPRYEHSDEELHTMGRALPLGRLGTPEEIADAIVFLASSKARFITGQVLH